MNITYDDLRPHLTKETRLWTEDDATRSTEGHEGIARAWKRLFGDPWMTAIADFYVDVEEPETVRIYPQGRVVCYSPDGHEIYQLTYEAMVALGMNTAADDPQVASADGLAIHVAPADYHLRFNLLVERIQDPNLVAACGKLKEYPEFWAWPAAISHHHNYEGGLIAHTIEVAEIALHIAAKFPKANLDVLLTAALWHDWGKILEYRLNDWTTNEQALADASKLRYLVRCLGATDYLVWTRNQGASTHIATSAIEFSRHANSSAVVHCILAHHGPVREWGSPEAPRTLEALLLHQADMLSAGYGTTK